MLRLNVALAWAPSVAISLLIGTIAVTAFSIVARIRSADFVLERKGTTRDSLRVTADIKYW